MQQWRLNKTVYLTNCRLFLLTHLYCKLDSIVTCVFKIGNCALILGLIPHGHFYSVRKVLHVFIFDQLNLLNDHNLFELLVRDCHPPCESKKFDDVFYNSLPSLHAFFLIMLQFCIKGFNIIVIGLFG